MKKHLLAIGTLSAVMLLAACGGGNDAAEKSAETAATTVEPAGSGELAQAAAGATGVPECDTYMTKVMACVEDKIPAAQRDMFKKQIEDSKASWAAVTDKAALANTCKQAMEQAKTSFGAMGCTF
ncbi:MAG: hypothetical protein ACRCY3_10120 [Sphingorhabdus sp.]